MSQKEQLTTITENIIFYISSFNLPKALLGKPMSQLKSYLSMREIDNLQSPLLFHALDILDKTWDAKLALLIDSASIDELNLNYQNLNHVNTLHQAILSNKIKSTQALFKKIQLCPSLVQRAYFTEYSFLQCAVMSQNVDMFNYILTKDNDFGYLNKEEENCLILSIKSYPTMLNSMQPHYSSKELIQAKEKLKELLFMRSPDVVNSRKNILSQMIELKHIEEEKKLLDSIEAQEGTKKSQIKI